MKLGSGVIQAKQKVAKLGIDTLCYFYYTNLSWMDLPVHLYI